MNDNIAKGGYLSGGSRLRRIYEKLQISGDKIYKELKLDFKSSWFPVYYTLSISDRPQTVMEITEQIAFSHITVKNIVKELSQVDLITVEQNPDDKRSKLISLTVKGKDLLKNLQPIWEQLAVSLEEILTSGHPDILNILEKIEKELEIKPLHERVTKGYKNELKEENIELQIRNAESPDFDEVGKLLVEVYSQLKGFPNQLEQPAYYKLLAKVGDLADRPGAEIILAVSGDSKIVGAVVFFSEMEYYGSGGTAVKATNAAGFRLLAVQSAARGRGIGKMLTMECINRAREGGKQQLIIHTTKAMQTAWKMYENLGFKRSPDLDFMQGELPVYGFMLSFPS